MMKVHGLKKLSRKFEKNLLLKQKVATLLKFNFFRFFAAVATSAAIFEVKMASKSLDFHFPLKEPLVFYIQIEVKA